MFVVQSALVKGRGGIATAVAHYERMFRAVGVRSVVLFSGPSIDTLRALGSDIIEAPPMLASPFAGVLPVLGGLQAELNKRTAGARVAAIVHSDLTLPAMRRLLPGACFATPCHSDKFKHKEQVDLVIALNAAQRDLAVAALRCPRVALLGNPYVADPPAPVKSACERPRFNFVGRFIATKDPLTLVRAAALLPENAGVRFIGDGDLAGEVRALSASLGLAAEFPGWAPTPFADFHSNDILVLPSAWEGLPYLLQEALDHGVPVIAADNAGNRAALADGAYGALFSVGDAAALAQAMGEALANLDALRSRAEKGRAALRARYGAEPFWRALSAELERVSVDA
jgi:glycosyltransferase involved in cell wall biosynthesis